jgi:DNA-binding LytR/AlgR family response regulator
MERQSNTNRHSFPGDISPIQISTESKQETGIQRASAKKGFLVYKHNKYIVIPTERIAFFYVKHDTTIIVTFDRQEYFVNYSLEQIQHLVSGEQFFRLNRQCLINFDSVKEVEHYFARKLLVNPVVPSTEKLLVSKERATTFLDWLGNR